MARTKRRTLTDEYREAVASYVAAGADEQVQRVITAVGRLSKRLDQWYDSQLADLNVSTGEWAVLSELARRNGEAMTPSQLAAATDVAPSSMTHRLDGLVTRGLVHREADPANRTRVLVRLSDDASLVVVGSRGRTPVQELLLGSVSQETLHRAACPVVVVR